MASLVETLLGAQSPVTQWTQRNSNLLTGLGTSLLSDGMNFQPAQVGATLDRQAAAQKEADAKLAASTNATKQWLAQNYPDLAQAVDAGLPVSEAWQEAFNRKNAKGTADPYQQRFQAGGQYGLTGEDLNTFALTGALPGTNKQNVTYGVTPIYGTDASGKTGMGVQGSDGSFKLVDTGGFQPLGPYDLNAQKAAGSAFGKNTGGAQFDLPAAELTMNQTIQALGDIRSQTKGMDEQFGNIMGVPQQMTPAWPGSEKAKFQVSVDRGTNLAFMQAREMLRGGGQITDFESRKAETAITNMQAAMEKGDKQQFQQALDLFEQAVKDGYSKLAQQASAMPAYGGQPAATPTVSDQASYAALPSGTRYIAPDGTTRVKP